MRLANKLCLLLLIAIFVMLGGCAHPRPTLVVTVGGLGFSQMHDLRMAVKEQCPDADVESAGAWDAYKAQILSMAQEKPRRHIVLVGHSFGCEAINKVASQLPVVDLAVFIDPAWDDFTLAPNIKKYLWYRRSDIGFEREAQIKGASGVRVLKGGHNDLPHAPQLVAEVTSAINSLGISKQVTVAP